MNPYTHSSPPIPRQPIGATFAVAVGVLGFFLILQFLAVAWYFLPILREKVVESATVASVQPAAEAPSSVPAGNPANPARPQVDPALVQKISRLVADSDRAYRVGDFETSLKGINESAELLPDDPGILLRRARLLESMQQPAEAAADYARVAALPNLPAELRTQAEKKLAQLGGASSGAPSSPASAQNDAPQGSDVRDETGLQPGASLGITDTRLRDRSPGTKALRVAIKARPKTAVETRQMKLHVFFYEQDEAGEILLTESQVAKQWISPPVDWADNEPELLDLTYILPDSNLPGSAASNGSPGRKFVGYIVGVYYNGELQDTQADPGWLARKFPLPLYLKQEAQ
ncbi:MAG: hypothetical protein WCS65_08420 [Verrucomicrobiae bacterium]